MEHCTLEQAWHALSDRGPQLRELHLSHCSFPRDSEALGDALQAAAARLELLDLSFSSSDARLAELLSLLACSAGPGDDASLPRLQQVDLRGAKARAGELCQLQSAAPGLSRLQLGDCSGLDELGLAALSAVSGLRALELSGVDDAALPWLQLLGSLEELSVSGRQLTGRTQRRREHPAACSSPGLGALTSLRSLSLLDCSFSAAGLSELLPLAPHLTSLRVESERLKNGGLAHLAALTALQSLALSGCWQVTGRASRTT